MAQTLLVTADKYHDRIRSSIDVGLGKEELENTVIDQDNYIGEVVRKIERVIPNAAALTGDNLLRAKNAAIYMTAARLCYVVVRKTALSTTTRQNQSISVKSFDPNKKAATLDGWADSILADLIVDLTPAELGESKVRKKRPSIVAVARGKRGR